MRCDSEFRDRILNGCLAALEEEGFTRFRKWNVDYLLGDGFHCWVGLNMALEPDRVELYPNVGVHSVPIMRLHAKIEGTRYDRGVATWATTLESLEAVGDERMFAFAPRQSDEFIASECRRLAHLYASVGLEYARSIASYEKLLPRLRDEVETLGGYPQQYASCLYLMGRKVEARRFVEDFLRRFGHHFEGFAHPFLRMLDEEGVGTGSV